MTGVTEFGNFRSSLKVEIIDLLNFLKIKVSNWTFFSFFSFFSLLVSGMRKDTAWSKIYLLEHNTLEFSHWGTHKQYWNSLKLRLFFIHKKHASFFSSRSVSKSFSFKWVFHGKIFAFPPFVSTLIDRWSGKVAISFGKARCSITSFLHKYLLDFFHQGLNWKLRIRGKLFPWKAVEFGPCIGILIVQKIRKSARIFDSCRQSNWLFSVTTGLISSLEISV